MSSHMLRTLKTTPSSILQLQQLLLRQPRMTPLVVAITQQQRHISTSKKNRDVTVAAGGADTTKHGTVDDDKPSPTDFSYAAAKKKWISFGFHWETEEKDLQNRNFTLFMTITICLIGVGYLLTYFPDVKRRHWYQREAFIELARREALGLPLIDEHLVPPSNINLPTEEELGNFEIVI